MPALNVRSMGPLAALGTLALAFVLYTQVVASGVTDAFDLQVARALHAAWRPELLPVLRAFAVLGGVEVTTLLGIAIAVYLLRRGFRAEAAALLALPAIWVLEAVYKLVLRHPPPLAFSHPDGPSLVTLLHGGTLPFGGSYPSGHMMRSVLIYGLAAFVVYRLAAPGRTRDVVVSLAAIVVGLMALDRLYLGVHWQSDVIGGFLLGGVALASAVIWLDRPRVRT